MKHLFLLCSLFLLLSCDSSKSLADLCKENPQICHEFGEDSWCKRERVDVALARIALKTQKQDLQKYHLLVAYEGYVSCMSLASQIQHIKLKEKTTLRKNNLLKAKAQLAELSEQTLSSKHPHLLYYHWSRELNKESLQQFIQLEGTNELENAISQYHLASYYSKKDLNKTLALLFHALELHQPKEKLIPEVLQTLATIFTNKNKPKQAYIWLKIYQLVENDNSTQIEFSLQQLAKNHKLNVDFLDKVAKNTLDKIEQGEFKTPKY